ncbi:MAG: DNA recombination protein RmuC [Deltaproteobacteria bacterium]|nr:DNA recombination protein RmuC [Deltaproteobacteria bacterium]
MSQLLENAVKLFLENESAISLLMLALTLSLLFVVLLRLFKKQPSEDIPMAQQLEQLGERLQGLSKALYEESAQNRNETDRRAHLAREEMGSGLSRMTDNLLGRLTENAGMQKAQLDSFARQLMALTRLNEEKSEILRKSVDVQLNRIRDENNRHLERIRETVDEQLHINLEKRVGESFKQVSQRLEQVYRGLGEMQQLANGVGDLKRVLTNVRARGTWGEVRLAAILEQILTPDQYDTNVATGHNSLERVEFALRLPGQGKDPNQVLWLPIDAKFPQEDYQRLLDALERADKDSADRHLKQLEMHIRAEAKAIHDKYVAPPRTTDFAIMFLPVEGLFAEVLRRPGLCNALQLEYRVVVTGPTTLSALLNSLQIGFRTLAIEKRTSEVWELLGALKTEFGRFGDALAKTRKKIQEAGNTIDQAEVRSRAISRKLSKVEKIQLSHRESEHEK